MTLSGVALRVRRIELGFCHAEAMGGVIGPAIGAGFVLVLCCAALAGARWPTRGASRHPARWALHGRRLGVTVTCLLLAGSLYTSYTYIAVPGLMFGTGGLAMYAFAYTMLLSPLVALLLPRLRDVTARHDLLTAADYVRARYGSHSLALAIALTAILATLPYLTLQVVGVGAVLGAMKIEPHGLVGGALLALLFLLLAGVVHRGGLRACVRLSCVTYVLGAAAVVVLLVLAVVQFGAPGQIFDAAARRDDAAGPAFGSLPGGFLGSVMLAVGTALTQLLYPHVLLVVMAGREGRTLKAATTWLPAWSLSLGVCAFLGVAALAAGVTTPAGHGELAVPELIRELAPPWLAGVLYAALAMAGLLPAALMVMGMALLCVRNIYVEYLHPTAAPKREVRSLRWPVFTLMAAAVTLAVFIEPREAVRLHLLGDVWILQILPAVVLSLFIRWFHRRALFAGWAAGVVTGTGLLGLYGFRALVDVSIGPLHIPVHVAVAALAVNLAVTTVLSPVLDLLGVPRGRDETGGAMPHEPIDSAFASVD
ncbi:sodium:solute symporter [Streptomyces sp. NPDC001904]|uniref:sodium:solute symporter family protein n=1 Tax=Streptomyces sp. NPDC001904 TaxID=3154531 RepID=UPI0033229DF7